MSYLGSPDAVTRFIAPGSVNVWHALVDGDTALDPAVHPWPSIEDGNLPAAQTLWQATGSNAYEEIRAVVLAVIVVLSVKSSTIYQLYTDAEELRAPTGASAADVAFHTDPVASGSFYYFNDGARPLNRLECYSQDEAESDVTCDKTVRKGGGCAHSFMSQVQYGRADTCRTYPLS